MTFNIMDFRSAGLFCAITLFMFINASGATCNDEQVERCRRAAENGNISSLPSGGSCIAKSYSHYTHLCTVPEYLPYIDHCCCAILEKVMCCRYQQAWDRFRCDETIDEIETTSTSWKIVVAILVTVGLVGIFVIGTVICFLRRRMRSKKGNKPRKPIWCGQKKKKTRNTEGQNATPGAVVTESGSNPTSDTQIDPESHTSLLHSSGHITEPSAPPAEDSEVFALTIPDSANGECGRPLCGSHQPSGVHFHNESDIPGTAHTPVCPSCSSCPPPTYEQSHSHQVLP